MATTLQRPRAHRKERKHFPLVFSLLCCLGTITSSPESTKQDTVDGSKSLSKSAVCCLPESVVQLYFSL